MSRPAASGRPPRRDHAAAGHAPLERPATTAWELGQALITAVRQATMEEVRRAGETFVADSRFGRELLFLVAHPEWTVRTVERIEVDQADSVESEILIDVDLERINRRLLGEHRHEVLLPLLLLPAGGGVAAPAPPRAAPHPVLGVDVHDNAGHHVTELPQGMVRRRLAAAVAEMMIDLIRVEGHPQGRLPLLAAAVHRLLMGMPPAVAGGVPVSYVGARGALEAALHRECRDIGSGDRGEPSGAVSVLDSRLGELLLALCRMQLVVVPVPWGRPRTSFRLRMPARALNPVPDRPPSTARAAEPHARLILSAIAVTAHADRVLRITLPEGVVPRRTATDPGVTCRFDVAVPRAFGQLEELCRSARTVEEAGDRWSASVLAHLASRRAAAAADCLRHSYVVGTPAPANRLQDAATVLEESSQRWAGGEAASLVTDVMGVAAPATLRRHHVLEAGTPGVVELRIPAVEEPTQRGRPVTAEVDLDLVLDDSETVAAARTVNVINLGLLSLLAVLLWCGRVVESAEVASSRSGVIATLLAIFPPIQAAQLPRPDTTRLLGLLALRHHRWGMLTVAPSLLLAVVLAFAPAGWLPVATAALAALAQAAIQIPLRRRPLPRAGAGEPTLLLSTPEVADPYRFDVLREPWSRQLTTEALKLGRHLHPVLCWQPERGDALERLLRGTREAAAAPPVPQPRQRPRPRTARAAPQEPTPELVGLLHGASATDAVTFTVLRGRPPNRWPWSNGSWWRQPEGRAWPVPTTATLLLRDPAEWVLDIFVGFPSIGPFTVDAHPIRMLVEATYRCRFSLLTIQSPALPPPRADGAAHLWLRMRVGVDDRPEWTRHRLRWYLTEVGRLRQSGFRVDVFEVPALGSTVDAQHLHDFPLADFGTGPSGTAEEPTRPWESSDILTTLAPPAAGRAAYTYQLMLPFAAPPPSGMLRAVLGALAAERPPIAFTGVMGGLLDGTAVLLVSCLGSGDPAPAASALRSRLRRRLAGSGIHLVGVRHTPMDAPVPAAEAVLRAYLTGPDRPGALYRFLQLLRHEASAAVLARPRRDRPVLSVMFAQAQRLDDGAMVGRLVGRMHQVGSAALPWHEVDWGVVGRRVQQRLAHEWLGGDPAASHPGLGPAAVTVTLDLVTVAGDRPDRGR